MKVLVFSDSHGTITYMQQAIRSEEPDVVLHLGDVMRDARALQREYPQLRLEQVCGNCDGPDAQPEELELTLQGHKIMMTHGHPYHVKLGSAWVVPSSTAWKLSSTFCRTMPAMRASSCWTPLSTIAEVPTWCSAESWSTGLM